MNEQTFALCMLAAVVVSYLIILLLRKRFPTPPTRVKDTRAFGEKVDTWIDWNGGA